MPTLPGRESSILAVLARHGATAASPARTFDWRALVQEARPGAGSEQQRMQAARFVRIRQDVGRWADDLGIPAEHLEESSFYATACVAPTARHEQAVALALAVYWIYLLDDFLDRRDFAALARQPTDAALDRDLGAILRPLMDAARGEAHAPANDTSADEIRPRAAWCARRSARRFPCSSASGRSCRATRPRCSFAAG